MQYTRASLIERAESGETLKYLFFWGHQPPADGTVGKSCLSQWWDCRFIVDGIPYHTAEQYMMAQKALLFGDSEIQAKIMEASHPMEYKQLGRQIRHFDEAVWNQKRTAIVIRGNYAKFAQNADLVQFLLGTNDRILVEASPRDRIWGIGISEKKPDCMHPSRWRGENLLGFCLMEVRDLLKR